LYIRALIEFCQLKVRGVVASSQMSRARVSPHGLEGNEEVSKLREFSHHAPELLGRLVHRRPYIPDEASVGDAKDEQNGEEVISFAASHNGLGLYPTILFLALMGLHYPQQPACGSRANPVV